MGRYLQQDRWKQFKVDYNVMRASMRVLLEDLGEEYFVAAKLVSNKNKAIEELSPYAKQFFKAFSLWTCSDKETKLSIHNLSRHGMLTAKYV